MQRSVECKGKNTRSRFINVGVQCKFITQFEFVSSTKQLVFCVVVFKIQVQIYIFT